MSAPIHQTPASVGDCSDQETFQGFTPLTANFLYCPNQFFDVCLSQCNNRGLVRVVAYVLRQQLGWVDKNGDLIHKDVSVSYDDLIQKAGVSNGAIGDAINAAVSLGFLRCLQQPKPHARQQTAQNGIYELCWDRTGQYVTDLKAFQGFYVGGHFTPIPNQFFDHVLVTEPLSIVKVVGAVIRHTIGYETKFGERKQRATLPYSFLAKYTHLSTGKILNGAVQSSLSKKYIQCVKQGVFDPRGREFGTASEYAIHWQPAATFTANTPKTPSKQSNRNLSKNTIDIAPKKPPSERSKKTTNKNTSLKDNNKKQAVVAPEYQEAFNLLMQVEFNGERFHEESALQLAESRGLAEIKQQITWLPNRKASRNPLGMLRSAIEQDWSAPVDIQERARNRESAQKMKAEEVAKAAQIDEVNRAKQERRLNRQQALPRWNAISKENQSTIEHSAYERLNSDFYRKLFRTNDDFRLEKCLDEMCRQEELAPSTTLVAK